MTPSLIFLGIPVHVAVGSEAAQILGTSFSGALAQLRRRQVDIKMGCVLLTGGLAGSTIGVFIFNALKTAGQADLFVRLCYVVFLGFIGILMGSEAINSLYRLRTGKSLFSRKHPNQTQRKKQRSITAALPFKMKFKTSQLYISPILPLTIGFVVGVMAALLGIGGGFILVPAMIYLLKMPVRLVVGTSLFQIVFVTANATFFQSAINYAVDITLAFILLIGGVIGVQIGTRLGAKLKSEYLRGLLALLVLAMGARLLTDLTIEPNSLFSLSFDDNNTP